MTSSTRLHSLDILRATAILLTFLFHTPKIIHEKIGYLSDLGWLGPELFFVLSGYLIGHQVFKDFSLNKRFVFKNFYVKRIFRTLPVYYVILALYFLFPIHGNSEVEILPLWRFLTFTANFYLIEKSPFSHVWSLCVEEQFYLFFPILVYLTHKYRLYRYAFLFFLVLFIFGAIYRFGMWTFFIGESKEWRDLYTEHIYFPTWGRLDGLTFGVLIAAAKVFFIKRWNQLTSNGNLFLIVGFSFLAISRIPIIYDPSSIAAALGPFLRALGLSCFLIAAISSSGILANIRIPGAKQIAVLSYSAYLINPITYTWAFMILKNYFKIQIGFLSWFIVILITFFCSAILYFSIEKPFIRLRNIFISD